MGSGKYQWNKGLRAVKGYTLRVDWLAVPVNTDIQFLFIGEVGARDRSVSGLGVRSGVPFENVRRFALIIREERVSAGPRCVGGAHGSRFSSVVVEAVPVEQF